MKKNYTIPIFIPEKACPFRCIYCNQYAIASKIQSPSIEEVKEIIETHLKTFPAHGVKRLGFFGGSFTGISMEEQNQYLDVVLPYIESNRVESIMLSTRPDYISEEILDNLKRYKVGIIDMGAHYTRVYPTLVIKDTALEAMYKSGEYKPLSLEQAVEWCKHLMIIFDKNNVTILRMGLHPSEGLITGNRLVAGPFHVSFKELVLSALWRENLEEALYGKHGKKIVIEVSSKSINAATGFKSANKKYFLEKFGSVSFIINNNLTGKEFNIYIDDDHHSR